MRRVHRLSGRSRQPSSTTTLAASRRCCPGRYIRSMRLRCCSSDSRDAVAQVASGSSGPTPSLPQPPESSTMSSRSEPDDRWPTSARSGSSSPETALCGWFRSPDVTESSGYVAIVAEFSRSRNPFRTTTAQTTKRRPGGGRHRPAGGAGRAHVIGVLKPYPAICVNQSL